MTLRIVLMSDIHGNLAALRAVVDSLRSLRPRHGGTGLRPAEHDIVVVAGDLCLDGPSPAEVLDLLDELGWFLLMGNTDHDLVAPPKDLKGHKAQLVEWTRRQLGESRLRRLASLDFSARITPNRGAIPILGPAIARPTDVEDPYRDTPLWPPAPSVAGSSHSPHISGETAGTHGVPLQRARSRDAPTPANQADMDGDALLAVHANPRNLEDHLRPTMSEEELRPYLGGIHANVLAFGHLHTPYVRPVGNVLLVDVASVGHPKDHDLRAAYTVLTWENGSRSVNQIRVPYDVEETVHLMRRSGMPDAEKQVASLLKASY